jgi:hypothetical protein
VAQLALKDRAQDRLSAALAEAATSLYLDDVTEFGSSYLTPPFLIIVDSGKTTEEIMIVTAVDETNKKLTVVRDALGTTDVGHAKGALVVHTGTPVVFNVKIADISSAETIHVAMPKCVVVKLMTVIEGTIANANAKVKLTKSGSDMANGEVTISYNGSAEGDMDIAYPTTNNEFDGVADYMEVVGDGGSTNTVVAMATVIAMME